MLRLLAIFVALGAYASESAIMLGILEQIPGRSVGEPSFRAVRVVFQKKGREWQPFPSACSDQACLETITSEYPPIVTWTIAFSGKSVGQVTAVTPKDFEYYSAIGLQNITSKEPVPAIAKKLVADSQPYYKDSDSWKPSHPSSEVAASLRLAFRKKFPKVSNCVGHDDENPKPWQYRDGDIKLNKAYSSVHNRSIVQVLLTGNRCDTPPDEPFIDQWFAVMPSGQTILLGDGMQLVDAGDYDNDGKSELVFAIDRANEGGYVLFYDDFKGHAAYQFSYH
jgi:hypothetical protein